MIGFIIWMLVLGLIAGAVARLLVPGDDPMGIAGTILLGGNIGYSQQTTEGSLGRTNTNEKLSRKAQFSTSPTAAAPASAA